MSFEINISQQQKISQNMIQQMTLLQMGAQELEDYLNELILENPLAELEPVESENKDQEYLKKIEWLQNIDEQNRIYYRQDNEDCFDGRLSNLASPDEEILTRSLMMQLVHGNYTKAQMEIFEYIAESLDYCGYFTDDLNDTSVRLNYPVKMISECLSVMKTLEPSGICASGLSECLYIQLENKEKSGEYSIEKKIVTEYLTLLGKNQLHIISRNLNLPLERIKCAAEVIRSLNPKPSSGYAIREAVKYISPDIIVVKTADYYQILIDEYSYPVLHINKDYMKLFKSSKCDKETACYISGKIHQIEQIQTCIQKRNQTLMKLARVLVENQSYFFQYGKAYLRPMKMKDAAQIMGVHESTVSRAVKDKYLQCCWGTYPLDYFFKSGIYDKKSQEMVTTDLVKQAMQAIIENENKEKPLSDQKLSKTLAEKGIHISRRTVAKYRESMGIADCRGRKQF